MKRFKNILLVFDDKAGEETILKQAAGLAKRNNAELTLVDIIDILPWDMEMMITNMPPMDLQGIAVNERQKDLDEVIRPFREEGVLVSAKVLCGRPFIEIIKEVLRNGHDLVIKTVETGEGILFGGTSMPLLRKCPCPVWVVKPTPEGRFARVLAAVNPLPNDDEENALNRKIMELAASLSELMKSELHVVHAWTLYYEDILRNRGIMSASEVDRLVRETENTHRGHLDKLLKEQSLKIPENHIHLLRGNAGKVIPKTAKEEEIELIVMGTVCRTGVSGLFIGNTAEKVLQKVDCSVLTVKPDGFVSPVTLDNE